MRSESCNKNKSLFFIFSNFFLFFFVSSTRICLRDFCAQLFRAEWRSSRLAFFSVSEKERKKKTRSEKSVTSSNIGARERENEKKNLRAKKLWLLFCVLFTCMHFAESVCGAFFIRKCINYAVQIFARTSNNS